MVTIEWWEVLIRLVGSIILGGAFGLERELHGRPAGLRTHILVCLGASLVMIVSMYGFGGMSDPARLAAQVISGIGFLGAGAIIREGGGVKGITTAATLWIVAMVGLAIGNGAYLEASVTTVIALIVLIILRSVEKRFVSRSHKLVIVVDGNEPMLKKVVEICDARKITIAHIAAKTIEYGDKNALQISADFFHGYKKEEIESLFMQLQEEIKPLDIKMH